MASNSDSHNKMANAIRFLSIDAVEKAKSGHPGMPMGMADVATILWTQFLRHDPTYPEWPNRDRFVLSAGHGSMLLYSLLYLTGYEDVTLDQLKNFRQLGSKTAGHPEFGYAKGIETTTGPLGQGIANAVGMALASKLIQAEFGSNLIDNKIYVIASDGDLMEGISQEVISLAGHLKLNNLIVLYDDNNISIDGRTDLSFSDDTSKRFEASHWATYKIDGHDANAITAALEKAQKSDKPILITCKTKIGYGSPAKVGTSAAHGSPLGAIEIEATRKNLNWPYASFEVPNDVLEEWRKKGTKNHPDRLVWENAFAEHPRREEFSRRIVREIPQSVIKKFKEIRENNALLKQTSATRQLSQYVLEEIAPLMPELIGGSADLTNSNNTKAKQQDPISAENFAGKYIHYGVREHGMAAIMNGLSLYGGIRPYGGTFLMFSDYLRPSLRLSALMHQPVIYVLTHDSIGLGEDGPTHQPIEHLAALRAIPNVNVFRPGDAVEVAECWELALEFKDSPSLLILTRQNIVPFRTDKSLENKSRKGGYVVLDSDSADVTLLSTGSEVGLALETCEALNTMKISARVVSIPCWRLFDQQSKEYRQQVLGNGLKVAIEAAASFGWERYVGLDGLICAIDSFGESAPAAQLYDKFGLTAPKLVEKICNTLQNYSKN